MDQNLQLTCLHCGGPMAPKERTCGLPKKYCSASCRVLASRHARPEAIRRHRETQAAWYQRNREKALAYWREVAPHRSTAKQQKAMPSWLTEEQQEQMRQLYLEARRLTAETGIRHEVDHIHPLQGETVCGLHVPWNLQILTMTENRRKKNRLADGLPSGQTLQGCNTPLEADG